MYYVIYIISVSYYVIFLIMLLNKVKPPYLRTDAQALQANQHGDGRKPEHLSVVFELM